VADDEVLERLDLILGVLQLAHDDAITRAREAVRSDPIRAAILDACADDWVAPAAIRERVVREAGPCNPRTLQRRLRELVVRRALKERGTTTDKSYRASGLI
jgi:hypothetical protein